MAQGLSYKTVVASNKLSWFSEEVLLRACKVMLPES